MYIIVRKTISIRKRERERERERESSKHQSCVIMGKQIALRILDSMQRIIRSITSVTDIVDLKTKNTSSSKEDGGRAGLACRRGVDRH